MEMRHVRGLSFALIVTILLYTSAAYADRSNRGGDWREVLKHERDLRKAEAYLEQQRFKRDRKGIRKAKKWVRKEQKDLYQAKSARHGLYQWRNHRRNQRAPRYRLHHSYQNLPKQRGYQKPRYPHHFGAKTCSSTPQWWHRR